MGPGEMRVSRWIGASGLNEFVVAAASPFNYYYYYLGGEVASKACSGRSGVHSSDFQPTNL